MALTGGNTQKIHDESAARLSDVLIKVFVDASCLQVTACSRSAWVSSDSSVTGRLFLSPGCRDWSNTSRRDESVR